MKKKNYLVPCFVVVQAKSINEANKLANQNHQTMHNDTVLLLDEELPTVRITEDISQEYPHSIVHVANMKKELKKHLTIK